MLRVSMWEMNRSDIACCLCKRSTICPLGTSRITLGVMAVALPMRRDWPARHPSPKKSPGPSIATTASLPVFESTESFTPPRWMYSTLLQGSPCLKMTSAARYSTIVRATPAESRNAWALNVGAFFDPMARLQADLDRSAGDELTARWMGGGRGG